MLIIIINLKQNIKIDDEGVRVLDKKKTAKE